MDGHDRAAVDSVYTIESNALMLCPIEGIRRRRQSTELTAHHKVDWSGHYHPAKTLLQRAKDQVADRARQCELRTSL